ncbi:DUF3343 domain-containing protein [Mesoterricola silvestris]|uniref:Putative Se/S carrier protein-like domain-containing protein n=1 Tax=Mesoterricola silvestris TaxID=2927979 RepID=A0AA48GKU8_9BACT|nr:DUF3343 domain-containing protein [Mesoterricola silvestris]BDU74921.1 hypothetical protein METEAL_40950 [Mesoterricola silvestris]
MLLLATYPSTHAALRAEQRLKAAGFAVDLIPVPRQIRSSCGFCLLVETAGTEGPVRDSGPEGLWTVLDPLPGNPRRRYEPHP